MSEGDISHVQDTDFMTLEVTLHQNENGDIWFKSSVLRLPEGRMRVTTVRKKPIGQVFELAAAEAFENLCGQIRSENQIVSLPDREILFGLAIGAGISVLSHQWEDGVRQIMVKIRKLFGNPWSLFEPEFLAMNGYPTMGELNFDGVVEKLFHPIRELRYMLNAKLSELDGPIGAGKVSEIRALVDIQSKMFAHVVDDILGETANDPKVSLLATRNVSKFAP